MEISRQGRTPNELGMVGVKHARFLPGLRQYAVQESGAQRRAHDDLMKDYLLGLVLALATCAVLWPLPPEMARGAVSHLLTLIAAVYVGFAIASEGRLSVRRQVAGCAVFVGFALAGLWAGWIWLVIGLALHGAWDFLHHGDRGHGVVPAWYVPACAAYDWLVALFVVWRYLA